MDPVPFLDLTAQYREIREEIDAAVREVIETATFIGGRPVKDFERAFGEFVGGEQCIGVANGTDALEIAMEALDLPRGSEVIVPANSFIATSEAVSRAGYRVSFGDVDEATYNLDPDDVERRVTGRTSAIVAVHLYGNPAPMGALEAIARRHGLALIEDAAQAHGATLDGRHVGTRGAVSTFSFFPGKNLGAYGDAGAIVCADVDLGMRMRMLANHGRTRKYEHRFEGRNSRLDALQAAILAVKLRHLPAWVDRRRALAARYRDALAGVGDLILPVETPGATHAYHLFVVRTAARDSLRAFLTDRGIATGIHYPVALPHLQAYAKHPQHGEQSRAHRLTQEILSLPMGDSLTSQQIDRVVDVIREFFGSGSPGERVAR